MLKEVGTYPLEQEESFLELLDQGLVNDTIMHISGQLFDEWNDSNCNEGLMYADFKIAQMSDDAVIINAFHEHWGITPDDEYWIG